LSIVWPENNTKVIVSLADAEIFFMALLQVKAKCNIYAIVACLALGAQLPTTQEDNSIP